MKVLITGGAGFIGSHLAKRLLQEGLEVVVLDDLSTGLLANVPPEADFIHGDMRKKATVSRATREVNIVFHLAAVSSVQDSLARPLEVHESNLSATLLLLEEARQKGVQRFVFASSAAVYGNTGLVPASETRRPAPLSHYAVQKLASEYYLSVYHRLYGLETVCLRYFNVFGKGQRSDSPYSGVIAKFTAAAVKSQSLVIYGDGCQSRDFCPVANVVEANLLACRAPSKNIAGRVFNVGTGRATSVVNLAKLIKELKPTAGSIVHEPGKPGEILFSEANVDRSRQFLGYQPSCKLAEGIKALLN